MDHSYIGFLNTFHDELKWKVIVSKEDDIIDKKKLFADNSIIWKWNLCN